MSLICTPRTSTLLTGVDIRKVRMVKHTVEIGFDIGTLDRLPFSVQGHFPPVGFNGKCFQCYGNFHTMKPRKGAESEIPSSASVSVSLAEEHVPGYLGRLWSAQILWVGGLCGYVRMSQFPLVIVMQANVTYNYLLSWACSTTFQQFPKKIESPHGQDALQRHHFYSGWGKIFWCFSFQSPFVILFIIHYELENLKGKKKASKLFSVSVAPLN